MQGDRLIQFQCQREGTLFYYQTSLVSRGQGIVDRCPVCGSRRIERTGREYEAVDERNGTLADFVAPANR